MFYATKYHDHYIGIGQIEVKSFDDMYMHM